MDAKLINPSVVNPCPLCEKRYSTGTLLVILFVIIPLGLTLAMFLRLYVLARSHATKIAAQERAVGKKSDKKALYF